jgi:biopolymer transport protein ExbB/TolQ
MGMLTIVLLVILVIAVINGAHLLSNKSSSNDQRINRLGFIKSLGLFAFVIGMLGQFLGLFQAFDIISSGMEISPAIMAQGVKVSMVTSIYGMIIFLIAYLLWFSLKVLAARKM